MGEKGEAYRKRKRALRAAEVNMLKAAIGKSRFQNLPSLWRQLSEAAKWIHAHPGEKPELEREFYNACDQLGYIAKKFRAAAARYENPRARLKVVK